MRRILKNIICGLALSTVLVAAPVAVESASAQVQDGLNMTKTADTQNTSVDTLIRNVINILLWAIGIVSVIMIIIGGIRSIGRVTSRLVPAMALIYVLGCLVVIGLHLGQVPEALAAIFYGAFAPEGIAGGLLGVQTASDLEQLGE